MGVSSEKASSGTTIDTYVAVHTVYSVKNLAHAIKNTHAANGLKYKIDGRLTTGGNQVVIKAETVIAAVTQVDDTTPNLVAKYKDVIFSDIVISVKAEVGAAQATYEIQTNGEAMGNKG